MTDMALTAKRKKSNAPAKEDIYMDEELPELTNILNGLNEVKQIKTKSQSITSEESLKTPKPKVSKLKILKLKKDPVEQPKNAEISKEQNIVLTPAIKSSVEDIIRNTCDFYKTFVRMIVWTKDRIEITVSSDMIENISPESNQLSDIHSQIFATLDQRDEEFNVVQNYEIVIASPGISEVLRYDRDFISFKGFDVTVTLIEAIKEKLEIKGALMGREDGNVILSLKGRLVKIPVQNVLEVRLPKPKFEAGDEEIRKLR